MDSMQKKEVNCDEHPCIFHIYVNFSSFKSTARYGKIDGKTHDKKCDQPHNNHVMFSTCKSRNIPNFML